MLVDDKQARESFGDIKPSAVAAGIEREGGIERFMYGRTHTEREAIDRAIVSVLREVESLSAQVAEHQKNHAEAFRLAVFHQKRAEAAEAQVAELKKDAAYWLIFFEDHERRPEIFTEESAARKRFEQISTSWNATLFRSTVRNFAAKESGA